MLANLKESVSWFEKHLVSLSYPYCLTVIHRDLVKTERGKDLLIDDLCLFADDCLLYRETKSKEDQMLLQCDLDRLIEWTK